tara:strand:+ start:306 stop:686 length:381 start_codon:yes stop_codon:yes gene_type:complete
LFVSGFNLLIHGTGIWLEIEEQPKPILQGGETTKLKVSVTNSTPFLQGIVLVNTSLSDPDNCTGLNILDSQQEQKFIPRRSAGHTFSINLEAVDSIQKEETCEIEVELIVNKNKIGSKFFVIELIS